MPESDNFYYWIVHVAIYHQRFEPGYAEISHPVQGAAAARY